MPHIVRGNRIYEFAEEELDACWNREDRERFWTLRARFPHESKEVILCMAWKRKFPGLVYDSTIELNLRQLQKI